MWVKKCTFFFQVKGFIIIIDSGLLRIFPTVNVEKIVSFEPLALSCFEKQRRKSTVRQTVQQNYYA